MLPFVTGFFNHKYLITTEFSPQKYPQKRCYFFGNLIKDFHKKGNSLNYFTLNKSGIVQHFRNIDYSLINYNTMQIQEVFCFSHCSIKFEWNYSLKQKCGQKAVFQHKHSLYEVVSNVYKTKLIN